MKLFIALLLTWVLQPLAGRADQLAWNTRAEVDKVVRSIQLQIQQLDGKPYYMVSYCSMCAQEYVEVWEVKEVVTVAILGTDFFQMNVFGQRILRSTKAILEEKYKEPIQYDPIPQNEDNWFLKGVDLAYVYIPSVDNYFRCVGKEFKLECDVHVEWIKIPKTVFNKMD